MDHKQHIAQKASEALTKGHFGKRLGLNTGCCNHSFLFHIRKKVMFALNSWLEDYALHFWSVERLHKDFLEKVEI